MSEKAPRSGLAPAPLSVDVGIVAAMSVEVGFLTDRLTKVRKYAGPSHKVIEGEIGGKLVALIVGGMGRTSARRAVELLLDGHRPRWVVSAGFAGALDPALKRNDIVIPSEVVDPDGRIFSIDLSKILDDPDTRPAGVRTGRLLTVDAILRTAAEKADYHARTEADVVDMETAAVASVCSDRGVRFLSIRVVSDDASEDLPKEVATLMSRSGSYRVGAALRAIWSRPSSLKDFLALHGHAQEAADRLAEVMLKVLAVLPE